MRSRKAGGQTETGRQAASSHTDRQAAAGSQQRNQPRRAAAPSNSGQLSLRTQASRHGASMDGPFIQGAMAEPAARRSVSSCKCYPFTFTANAHPRHAHGRAAVHGSGGHVHGPALLVAYVSSPRAPQSLAVHTSRMPIASDADPSLPPHYRAPHCSSFAGTKQVVRDPRRPLRGLELSFRQSCVAPRWAHCCCPAAGATAVVVAVVIVLSSLSPTQPSLPPSLPLATHPPS